MFNAETVLVLAPHTDDGEFGCGGTTAKLIEAGARVISVAFSAAEQSVPKGFPRDVLRSEVKDVTRELGIAPEDCIVLHCEVRRFSEHRQAILDDLIQLREKYRPDLVFLPSRNDTHQDHEVIAQEGFRAFKRTTMLGYEAPWNNLDFTTTCFSILSESHLNRKIAAIEHYHSQAGRPYASAEGIRSLAKTRGIQSGRSYAEVFEVVRWLID